MRLLMVLLITVCLIFSSCSKDSDNHSFPSNTEIGANIFVFRVNGGEIINSQVGYIPAMSRMQVFYSHKDQAYGSYRFEIIGRKELLGINRHVAFNIKTMPSAGKYTLAGGNDYADYSNSDSITLRYLTDPNHVG